MQKIELTNLVGLHDIFLVFKIIFSFDLLVYWCLFTIYN